MPDEGGKGGRGRETTPRGAGRAATGRATPAGRQGDRAAPPLPPLREVIHRHGLAPRKALGQNFLLDLNLTRKIARLAGDLRQADVLEIGPGPGGLTRALLEEGARKVVVIEKDRRAIPALEEIARAWPGRLEILEGDALALDRPASLAPPVKVVANLPYNVGTELFVRWMTPPAWPPFWESLTLMFQREVAERIVAGPGSRSYGRLSVLAQWRARPRIVMTLPPSAFTPPPKVHSAVVQVIPTEPVCPADPKMLERVVAAAFNQRRKMLRASLKRLAPNIEAVVERAGIDPRRRAETVSVAEFCALAGMLARV